MFLPASDVELEKEQETGPHTAVFQARGQRFFSPRFPWHPRSPPKTISQGMTQEETFRHCKTCGQTVRYHTTAATPWAPPHLPPTSQAFIMSGVHFTYFEPGSAWQHKLPTSTAASAPEAFGETALGVCGLWYEGREHQAEPSATYTWAKGWVWVLLLGVGRAQRSSCIPGEDIHSTQPSRPWVLLASDGPNTCQQSPQAQG